MGVIIENCSNGITTFKYVFTNAILSLDGMKLEVVFQQTRDNERLTNILMVKKEDESCDYLTTKHHSNL